MFSPAAKMSASKSFRDGLKNSVAGFRPKPGSGFVPGFFILMPRLFAIALV